MRVLFLNNSFGTGGAEQLTLEIVRRLQGDEFRFHMLCLKGEGNLAPEMRKLGVTVDAGFLRGKFDLLGPRRAARHLRGEEFDLLFTGVGRNLLWASGYLARTLRIPKRITAVHATGHWGRSKMFTGDQVRILRRLDGVIACAATQGEYLVREEGVDPSNLTVIFNGVDHEKFRPWDRSGLPPAEGAPAPGEKGVGVVASLTPEKGHDVFVDAAALTIERVPEARFLVIGEGPEREKIEGRIRAKGLEGIVRLLGRRRDLPTFLPRLDLLALPSHPFRETLPISTMEGMACGLPTVNTDVGSVRDLVVDGGTGRIVPPGDPGAMAEAFAQILGDPAMGAALGRAGRRRIEEKFTLERTVDDYRRYFLRVAGRGAEA
ncbi:MAG: glycosyltransferase [Candidatus Eisenbacteria bacterium]